MIQLHRTILIDFSTEKGIAMARIIGGKQTITNIDI